MSSTAKKIIHTVAITLAAAAFEVFLVLCLAYYKTEWGSALYLAALIGGSILNAAVLAVDLTFFFLKKEVIYKSCITIYFLAVLFAVLFYILIATGFIEIMRDKEEFQAFLARSGKWMIPIFILLQFLQVVILPIPSTVTVLAGAALFGPFLGSIYSLIGIIVGSIVAFLIGRYAGFRVAAWLVGKDTLEMWLKKIEGKDKLLLSAMFLLPVFPDDVLCIVAGISSMSFWLFLGVIFVSRVLAIFATSYSVSIIPFNTWWGILTWIIIFALVIVLFILLYKKSDAILAWIAKKFHRETRIKSKPQEDEFTLKVVDPNGSIVEKGVKKGEGSEPPRREEGSNDK